VNDPAEVPVVVDVRATIDAAPSQPHILTEHVRSLLEDGAHYILLNLVNITYADSLMLGAVMQAYSSAIRRGATLKLINASKRFRELLAITKLDRVIETVESDESHKKKPVGLTDDSQPI
jgi:anti-anti-sigma factor